MEIKKVIKQVPVQKVDFEEREVNVYVTKDGKEYSDEKMALAHEESLKYKERRKNYDNIEKIYVGDIPNYQSIEILKIKSAEEAKAILAIDTKVKSAYYITENIGSMKFPNIVIISEQLDNNRDRFYYFETIKDIIEEYQPFVDFYNKMLEIKKEYDLGDNQYE